VPLAGIGINGPVNVLESCGDRLAVFPGDEIETVAQQMHDAGLHRRLRKDGGNRIGKPFEAVDDGDQDIIDTTVLQLVHDAQPEFGTLILLEPEAEDFLGAVGTYAQRDMHSLVANQPFVADLDPLRVKEN